MKLPIKITPLRVIFSIVILLGIIFAFFIPLDSLTPAYEAKTPACSTVEQSRLPNRIGGTDAVTPSYVPLPEAARYHMLTGGLRAYNNLSHTIKDNPPAAYYCYWRQHQTYKLYL